MTQEIDITVLIDEMRDKAEGAAMFREVIVPSIKATQETNPTLAALIPGTMQELKAAGDRAAAVENIALEAGCDELLVMARILRAEVEMVLAAMLDETAPAIPTCPPVFLTPLDPAPEPARLARDNPVYRAHAPS